VFPVRYELQFYIAFRRNSVFKGLNGRLAQTVKSVTCIRKVLGSTLRGH
jgi:hypothetical protein